MRKWFPAEENMIWKIIFSVVIVRVIQKTSVQNFMRNIKPFSKNEKHTPKKAQKYSKIAFNRNENDVKISVMNIIVSSDAGLDMTRLRIW